MRAYSKNLATSLVEGVNPLIHPLYSSWRNMNARCNSSKCKDYSRYGERGIKIDPSWKSFARFVEDMGPKPTPLHTLERKDNSQGYSKANCCWATKKEQANNRRDNVLCNH
jgi:hypothetical protein